MQMVKWYVCEHAKINKAFVHFRLYVLELYHYNELYISFCTLCVISEGFCLNIDRNPLQ